MLKRLNLGCGSKWKEQYPDYEGLDIIDYGQEYVGDVKAILPTLTGHEYDEIMANHFLEHFDQDELQDMFSLINKALRDGGIFKFVVPHMDKERAWVLPHKTYWNETVVKWLEEEDARAVYGFGSWEVSEVVTNSRKDIHIKLKKK